MQSKPTIVLLGKSGTGKSAVAQALGARLSTVDLDMLTDTSFEYSESLARSVINVQRSIGVDVIACSVSASFIQVATDLHAACCDCVFGIVLSVQNEDIWDHRLHLPPTVGDMRSEDDIANIKSDMTVQSLLNERDMPVIVTDTLTLEETVPQVEAIIMSLRAEKGLPPERITDITVEVRPISEWPPENCIHCNSFRSCIQ